MVEMNGMYQWNRPWGMDGTSFDPMNAFSESKNKVPTSLYGFPTDPNWVISKSSLLICIILMLDEAD